jgi:alginate O-acetyltransferase complex protein AlgI
MIFSSHIFLFAFLPLFLSLYYLTPNQYRSLPILIGSYIFYAWWRVDFIALFAGVTIWNYFVYKKMMSTEQPKRWMQVGIIGNLLTLVFFKYANFGVESFNQAISAIGAEPVALAHIILPIGISFYIFQAISFLVDIYRKEAPHPKSFIDFAAYISLFPQLIAGPILRYKDIAGQFQDRIHTMDKFSEGAYRFMIGFVQKILIADSLAPLVDQSFSVVNPSFVEAWLGALAFTTQLYFDFLGYSSMAIGLGLMMGFRFMENFNHPYLSRSITEFWRRWHISLSSWLKDYLYIPLGGNRKGGRRTYINLITTMVLGGLWHGANWTFMLWGAWHGALLAVERALGIKEKARSWLRIIPTLLAVLLGWVLFRSETLQQAINFYRGMMGQNGFAISDALHWQITYESLFVLALSWIIVFIHPKYLDFRRNITNSVAMKTIGYTKPLISSAVVILFIFALMKLAAGTYSPFLYFQF